MKAVVSEQHTGEKRIFYGKGVGIHYFYLRETTSTQVYRFTGYD